MTPEPNSSQLNPPESNVTVESLNGANPNVPGEPATTIAVGEPENFV